MSLAAQARATPTAAAAGVAELWAVGDGAAAAGGPPPDGAVDELGTEFVEMLLVDVGVALLGWFWAIAGGAARGGELSCPALRAPPPRLACWWTPQEATMPPTTAPRQARVVTARRAETAVGPRRVRRVIATAPPSIAGPGSRRW
ncbi:MAG: hypothetical protein DLM61_15255 [Pseudonocardiales bacterium]|nr:MAG: hypothetical protein DLM61_15255 [Pseudonocardiales bacterium]